MANLLQMNLSKTDINILENFFERRAKFDSFLQMNAVPGISATCPSCGFATLGERNRHEICKICNWQDDGQDNYNASDITGGPNYSLSLTDSRLLIGKELQAFAEESQGNIVSDPYQFISMFQDYVEIMANMEEDPILQHAKFDDPVWQEWYKAIEAFKKSLVIK